MYKSILKEKNVSIDVKKMKGEWKGYYRIRYGKIRIIIKVIKERNEIVVDTVDFREGVY